MAQPFGIIDCIRIGHHDGLQQRVPELTDCGVGHTSRSGLSKEKARVAAGFVF